METFELSTEAGPIPARMEGGGERGILLATGAGTGQDHPGVAGLRSRLAEHARVMTFEYAYRAQGRPFPDRPPKLLSVHRAAVGRLREVVGENLFLAGRSMGGRMSTMLAAEGELCRGVVAFGYPLHPSGKPDRLRVEHLGGIGVPVLFLQGTRDALATASLVDEYLVPLSHATVEWVEGADHSFRCKGTSSDDMLDRLAASALRWMEGL